MQKLSSLSPVELIATFKNLFCLRELGYSEPQAQLRIDAMRALRDVPEIEERVRAGKLNVSTVAKAQRFFQKEKQRLGIP